MTAAEDGLSEASSLDTSVHDDSNISEVSSQNISPRRQRQRRCSVSADHDTRRCRSLSSDRDRQEYSPARTADDMDMIDGVQPLAQADASPVENGAGAFGRCSSLSQSVDSVVITSAASNKRKAVATLPGNEQKSHRPSL